MISHSALSPASRLTFNLYDNIVIALLFLFLPFNYAMTIRIGFPLKISEIALILSMISIVIVMVMTLKIQGFSIKNKETISILLFIFVATLSCLANLKWHYSYPPKVFEARSGYQLDSLLKLFYLYLNLAMMLLATNAFRSNRARYSKLLFQGATIAAIYTWYLAISSFYGYTPYLLPGMDAEPQKLSLSNDFSVIRCGTFKEGNYMGVFLLIAGVIAFYFKKYKKGLFFLFSIIPTFSTIAILSSLFFLVCVIFKRYFRMRYLLHLLLILLILFSTVGISLLSPTLRFILVDKFIGSDGTNASYSKTDRLNSVKVSKDITYDNPILGVGLSNYGLHYDHYNTLSMSQYENEKPIPNNVYMETLCETGFLGASLFLLFIMAVYKKTKADPSGVLRYGFIALLLCFNTFPTFSILFIWVFIGLILSLNNENTTAYS